MVIHSALADFTTSFSLCRQALEAADARIHAQNAALVEQEASLQAANRLLAQLASKYSAAR